jgi:hypothetical protein
MLMPLIRKRIENFTPILASWFLETRAWTHLNRGCPVDHVLLDLMACLSCVITGLKGGEEAEALERVRSKLDYFGLPNVAAVFREKFKKKELSPLHAYVTDRQLNRAQLPATMPRNSCDLWMEPFACQRRFRSLNSHRTCRHVEDLTALIALWRHDGEVYRHLHCEYESWPSTDCTWT